MTNTRHGLEMTIYLVARIAAVIIFIAHAPSAVAQSCSGNDLIDVTFANGNRWDMCWEMRELEGVVLQRIHFTPVIGAPRRNVLYQANLAEVHATRACGGPRYRPRRFPPAVNDTACNGA